MIYYDFSSAQLYDAACRVMKWGRKPPGCRSPQPKRGSRSYINEGKHANKHCSTRGRALTAGPAQKTHSVPPTSSSPAPFNCICHATLILRPFISTSCGSKRPGWFADCSDRARQITLLESTREPTNCGFQRPPGRYTALIAARTTSRARPRLAREAPAPQCRGGAPQRTILWTTTMRSSTRMRWTRTMT